MEDNFKKYVDNNRAEFDQYSTDFDSVWSQIDSQLTAPKKYSIMSVIWKVAAAVVILALSLAVFHLSNRSDIPRELLEAEAYYGELIDSKMVRLKVHEKTVNPGLFSDLSVIDSAYQDLKKDLKDEADNEEVVSAMIQTYRLKLEILERILEEIETERNETDQNEISI